MVDISPVPLAHTVTAVDFGSSTAEAKWQC